MGKLITFKNKENAKIASQYYGLNNLEELDCLQNLSPSPLLKIPTVYNDKFELANGEYFYLYPCPSNYENDPRLFTVHNITNMPKNGLFLLARNFSQLEKRIELYGKGEIQPQIVKINQNSFPKIFTGIDDTGTEYDYLFAYFIQYKSSQEQETEWVQDKEGNRFLCTGFMLNGDVIINNRVLNKEQFEENFKWI